MGRHFSGDRGEQWHHLRGIYGEEWHYLRGVYMEDLENHKLGPTLGSDNPSKCSFKGVKNIGDCASSVMSSTAPATPYQGI